MLVVVGHRLPHVLGDCYQRRCLLRAPGTSAHPFHVKHELSCSSSQQRLEQVGLHPAAVASAARRYFTLPQAPDSNAGMRPSVDPSPRQQRSRDHGRLKKNYPPSPAHTANEHRGDSAPSKRCTLDRVRSRTSTQPSTRPAPTSYRLLLPSPVSRETGVIKVTARQTRPTRAPAPGDRSEKRCNTCGPAAIERHPTSISHSRTPPRPNPGPNLLPRPLAL